VKILCAYSSIEFTCDHFPASLFSREAYHPIFNLPQKKLLSYIGKWSASELTPIDSYLLFLATLNSSDLIEFRVPAIRTDRTDSLIAQNMEPLMKTIIRLNTVMNPAVVFPRYVISPETRTLDNVHHWIQNWKEAYQDFLDGYKSVHESQDLIRREHAIERLIKSPHRPIASYAASIADWAAIAGEFPASQTISRITGKQLTISDYWKEIIIRCTKEEQIFSINREDLEELIEHCEINISAGPILAHHLFKVLRHARERQKNFLGLGDLDIRRSTFQILTSSDSVEDANLRASIQSAPLDEPKIESYPSKFAYMKAKFRYDMAKKYTKEGVDV